MFEIIRNNRVRISIVFFMTSVYFFSYFQRVSVPGTIFDELQSDFAASAASITLLGAIGLYAYASMQLFTGILADRLGAARVLLAGSAILTVGSVFFPLSHSLAMLYAMRVLVGMGAGLIFLSLAKEIDELFDESHFAMVLSLGIFFGGTGGVVATFPLAKAVNTFGWRQPMLAAGILCGAAFLCTWRLLHKSNRIRNTNSTFSWSTLVEILVNKSAMPLLLCGAATFSIYFLFQGAIGKKMLQDCFGFSSAAAASYTLVMMAVNITGMGISGFVSRLIGNRRRPILIVVAIATLLSISFLAIVLWKKLTLTLVFPCYLVIAAAASVWPIFCAAMKETNKPRSTGTALGLLNATCYLFVALVMNLAGIVMDMYKAQATVTPKAILYPVSAYISILAGCSVFALTSVIASFLIKETYGRSIYVEKTAA